MTGYDRQFLLDSVALLQGTRASHMGVHQYADHSATRYGRPMSGAALCRDIEHNHKAYYIPSIERQMIAAMAEDVKTYVPEGTPFGLVGSSLIQPFINNISP